MRKGVNVLFLAAAVLAVAFFASALAVEWRQDTIDAGPLAREVASLRDAIRELQITPTPLPEPSPTPTPTPTPTVIPTELPAEAGFTIELDGVLLTAEEFTVAGFGGHVEFVAENISDAPVQGIPHVQTRAVDRSGFVCSTGQYSSGPQGGMNPGEKARLRVYWGCSEDRPKFVIIDKYIFYPPYIPRAR